MDNRRGRTEKWCQGDTRRRQLNPERERLIAWMKTADAHDSGSVGWELTIERTCSRQTDPLWSLAALVRTDTDAADHAVRSTSKNCEDNLLKFVRKKYFTLARVLITQVLSKEVCSRDWGQWRVVTVVGRKHIGKKTVEGMFPWLALLLSGNRPLNNFSTLRTASGPPSLIVYLPWTCTVTFLSILCFWPLEHPEAASPMLHLCADWKFLVFFVLSLLPGCTLFYIQWKISDNYSLICNTHISLYFPSVTPQHLSLRYLIWHSFWALNLLP